MRGVGLRWMLGAKEQTLPGRLAHLGVTRVDVGVRGALGRRVEGPGPTRTAIVRDATGGGDAGSRQDKYPRRSPKFVACALKVGDWHVTHCATRGGALVEAEHLAGGSQMVRTPGPIRLAGVGSTTLNAGLRGARPPPPAPLAASRTSNARRAGRRPCRRRRPNSGSPRRRTVREAPDRRCSRPFLTAP